MAENNAKYKTTCKMFSILANRASTVEDPRINTHDFSTRLGIKRKNIKLLLEHVEWYCYEKGLPSLSALVVQTHKQGGKDVSFPGDWFGKYIPEIMTKKIPKWKTPLTKQQRRWYRAYWPEVRTQWETMDIAQKLDDFCVWLKDVFKDDDFPERRKPMRKFEEWFSWPSTVAPIGLGNLKLAVMHPRGIFSRLGYRVGNNDNRAPNDDRKEILDWMFNSDLPNVNSSKYMAEFAEPMSSKRLQKMANFLASEARNFARNITKDYSQAISDYKVDLDYLYEKYYVNFFEFDKNPNPDFEWPDFPDYDGPGEPHKTGTSGDVKPKLQVVHEPQGDSDFGTEPQQPTIEISPSEEKVMDEPSVSTVPDVESKYPVTSEPAKSSPSRMKKLLTATIIGATLAAIYIVWQSFVRY